MASNGEVISRSFRWLSKKSHPSTLEKASTQDTLSKSNISIPGFRNNFISGDATNCVVVRNDIKRSVSTESESVSSTSRQSSVDSYTSSNSSDGMSASEQLGIASSSGSTSTPMRTLPTPLSGPKFKLIHEGDIQVCRINHNRTVIHKILSSKFLRRWESHHLYLSNAQINSKTAIGYMESSVPYGTIEDMTVFPRWEATQKYCLCVVIPDGSLLLQVNNAYVRDQWFHSITWKKNMLKFKKLLTNTRRPDVFIKELKGLVDMTLTTPLQDDSIYNSPLEVISELLHENFTWFPKTHNEELITLISPLLEMTMPTPEICDFLTQYCRDNPRSRLVLEQFTPIIQRILKHNMDFGKCPKARLFVQEYIQALSYQNDERPVLENFVSSMHGFSSTCPHPRNLPNLVSICLAAIYALYEEKKNRENENNNNDYTMLEIDWRTRLRCFALMLEIISGYEDWRPALSLLLQPIPFPDEALKDSTFTGCLKPALSNIVTDERCAVHLTVLSVREEKGGWLSLFCPGGVACDDDGDLWSEMIKHLLNCCCRRKQFLESFIKSLGHCMLRALRDDEVLQDTLCSILELGLVENKDLTMQVVATLQSTTSGKQKYTDLCQRQMHLRELQSKGGPRKLTLPSRSTDADVAKLLSCGSFGNLECLSLAFTQVTSACAEHIIKLPSLKYLNLWSTQFGDVGLRLICEHLLRLQVLNLCETPVTDKGLICLTNIKSLRRLNLNSTHLSAHTFEKIKQNLPALQECDIRYTEAW